MWKTGDGETPLELTYSVVYSVLLTAYARAHPLLLPTPNPNPDPNPNPSPSPSPNPNPNFPAQARSTTTSWRR